MNIDVLVSCTRPNLVSNCLQSLLGQTRKPDTIIVVIRDFDSDSKRVINIFKKNHSLNIKEVIVLKPGAVMAANAGIQASKGDILCFIDDDAQARTDWLKRIEAYYRDEKIGGVGGRDIIYIRGKIIGERVKHIGQVSWYGRVIGKHHCIIDKAGEVFYLKGCNMSYRRRLLFLLDERLSVNQQMAEHSWELEIGFALHKKGYKLIFDPNIIVKHYPATSYENWYKRRFTGVHNEVYILLKYFSLLRKLAYIIYTFLVGHNGNLGFLRYIIKSFVSLDFKGAWIQFLEDVKFKIKGIKDYLIK